MRAGNERWVRALVATSGSHWQNWLQKWPMLVGIVHSWPTPVSVGGLWVDSTFFVCNEQESKRKAHCDAHHYIEAVPNMQLIGLVLSKASSACWNYCNWQDNLDYQSSHSHKFLFWGLLLRFLWVAGHNLEEAEQCCSIPGHQGNLWGEPTAKVEIP